MQTQHPTVVRRSYFALCMFFIVCVLLLAVFINAAWKVKKEKEQVAPITNHKTMPALVPLHQDQVVSTNKGPVRVTFTPELTVK